MLSILGLIAKYPATALVLAIGTTLTSNFATNGTKDNGAEHKTIVLPQPSASPIPTVTVTMTHTPRPIPTPTLVPTFPPTPTPTPTSTPTPTPMPTGHNKAKGIDVVCVVIVDHQLINQRCREER